MPKSSKQKIGHVGGERDLTKPVTYQNIKNDTVPPTFIEVW